MFEDFNSLPDIITKEIFEHLTFKDICNIMLVSRKWHEYVGNKSFCMNKLRLKIEGWQDLEIVTNILMKNSRRYSSIVVNNLNPSKEFPYLESQHWKDVHIQQMRFLSTCRFFEYIAQFGESLKVLDLEKIIVNGEEISQKSLVLPRLRELKLKQVPTTAFQVFSRYPNLNLLHFDIPAFGTQSRSLIISFFENFRNVKIENLSIRRNSLYGLSSEAVTSIEAIIISMSESLKTLIFQDWGCCHTLERLWNQLQVSHFSINFCSHQPMIRDLRNLDPNNKLAVLEISLLNIPEIDWCKNLFLLTPCLKRLFITKIRKEIVHHAAHYLHQLEIFSYASCIIDIIGTEFNASDEDDVEIIEIEDEELGADYDFIGKDEIFDLSSSATRPLIIKRYSDYKLNKSFANSYYFNIRRNETCVNPFIKFQKRY